LRHASAPPTNNASRPNIAAIPLLLPVKASVPCGNGWATVATGTTGGPPRKTTTVTGGATDCGEVVGPPKFVFGTVWSLINVRPTVTAISFFFSS